jgi:hypothetical protein
LFHSNSLLNIAEAKRELHSRPSTQFGNVPRLRTIIVLAVLIILSVDNTTFEYTTLNNMIVYVESQAVLLSLLSEFHHHVVYSRHGYLMSLGSKSGQVLILNLLPIERTFQATV